MYGLTAEDLRIRDTAAGFVETLMPYEVEAELAGGLLPKEVAAEHRTHAIELGLYATNMPKSVGAPGYSALQQVLVQKQAGRVTNGLGWVMATPPQWRSTSPVAAHAWGHAHLREAETSAAFRGVSSRSFPCRGDEGMGTPHGRLMNACSVARTRT